MSGLTISRATMFDPLLIADPSFETRWAEFVAEWDGDPEPPLYLALSSLARHLLARLEAGDTADFDRIFAVIEQWHTNGDIYVREAASVGLLEDLQNLLGGSGKRPVTVEPWLGPESRRCWDKLDRFWEGDDKALRID